MREQKLRNRKGRGQMEEKRTGKKVMHMHTDMPRSKHRYIIKYPIYKSRTFLQGHRCSPVHGKAHIIRHQY